MHALISQTYHNVVEFALAQFPTLPTCHVWQKTLKILQKRPDLIQKSEHKEILENALATVHFSSSLCSLALLALLLSLLSFLSSTVFFCVIEQFLVGREGSELKRNQGGGGTSILFRERL
jgi:hypothetical protein